mmetsp:Transcript_37608/g.112713  ORF Transcript_37608/g.112713 Transcript_37608/m.112713 type:complete len:83 (+) Transcript_37608:143-391(+)
MIRRARSAEGRRTRLSRRKGRIRPRRGCDDAPVEFGGGGGGGGSDGGEDQPSGELHPQEDVLAGVVCCLLRRNIRELAGNTQ